MLFFIAGQLFVFYRSGMVFSPWYNYGMYSEVIKPQKEYALYNVYDDGKIMAGNDYSPQQWDQIHFNLVQADAAACNSNFYEKEISRLFHKFHLPTPGIHYYTNNLFTTEAIKQQYSIRLAKDFDKQHIEIKPMLYQWNDNELVAKDSLKVINSNSFQCK
ncbi:hypothetical protein BH10BAC3_BH10BAC3_40310 [soil metagenome]